MTTVIVRSGLAASALRAQDEMDTINPTDGIPDPDRIPPERGIEGVNRLLIEAPPSLVVPEDLRPVTVPDPVAAWHLMLAAHECPYQFEANATPNWGEFVEKLTEGVTASINNGLREGARAVNQIQEQSEASTRMLADANAYLSNQIQSIARRMEEVLEARNNPRDQLQVDGANLAFRAPIPAIPRFEKQIFDAIHSRQYNIKAIPVSGRRRSRSRSRPATQIQSTRARARQASRVRARRDTITTSRSPDPTSDDEFHESEVGDDTYIFRSQSPQNFGTRDHPSIPVPETPAQPPAALSFLQAVEANRPRTAIGLGQPAPTTQMSTVAPVSETPATSSLPTPRAPTRVHDLDRWPRECGNCHQTGHSTGSCPRCEVCEAYGHGGENCKWCRICRTRYCRERCPECRIKHSHLLTCGLLARAAAAQYDWEEGGPQPPP